MKFDESTMQQFYRYSYTLTGDSQSAYDLLQGALEKYLRLKTIPDYPIAYMRRIIHNRFIDDYRRTQAHPIETYDEADTPSDIDERTLERVAIASDMVTRIFEFLNPPEREVLYFWAVEGMTAAQIAEQLDIPRGTILSRIHRMRQRLINQFGDDYSDGVAEVGS